MSRIFDEFDANRSGFLDYREARKACRSLGLDVSTEQAIEVLRAYDDEPDGLMDEVEFRELIADVQSGQTSLSSQPKARGPRAAREARGASYKGAASGRGGSLTKPAAAARRRGAGREKRSAGAAFELFDTEASGRLGYRALAEALHYVGFEATTAEAEQVLRAYDDDRDGLIDEPEFSELLADIESGHTRLPRQKPPKALVEARAREAREARGHRRGREQRAGRARGSRRSAYRSDEEDSCDSHDEYDDEYDNEQHHAGRGRSDKVHAAFRKHDVNRSGFLDYREARKACRSLGLDVSTEQAIEVLRAYDDEPDGLMDEEEFRELIADVQSGRTSLPPRVAAAAAGSPRDSGRWKLDKVTHGRLVDEAPKSPARRGAPPRSPRSPPPRADSPLPAGRDSRESSPPRRSPPRESTPVLDGPIGEILEASPRSERPETQLQAQLSQLQFVCHELGLSSHGTRLQLLQRLGAYSDAVDESPGMAENLERVYARLVGGGGAGGKAGAAAAPAAGDGEGAAAEQTEGAREEPAQTATLGDGGVAWDA